MEQSNKWYRFPIQIYDREIKELTGKEELEPSFFDARIDTIGGMRVSYDENMKQEGTFVYFTTGEHIFTPVKLSTLRKLLNYEPIKIEADEF